MFRHYNNYNSYKLIDAVTVPLLIQSLSSFLPSCFHSYISKVGVLKILVKANYKYVPSLDDILETSAVTCLRNQLLEAEHYQLAVEVRCSQNSDGFDPGQVGKIRERREGSVHANVAVPDIGLRL